MRRKEREENEVAEMKARKEALANAKEKGKAKAKSKKKKDKKDEAPKPADGSKPSVPYSGAAWGAMPPAAADSRSGSRPAESRVLGVLGGTQPLSGGTCGTAIVHGYSACRALTAASGRDRSPVHTCPPVASALGMVGAHARHADAAEESWQSYSPSAQARQACLRRSARAPLSVARWI